MAEKQPKRKRTEEHKMKKKVYDHKRGKTRVNIGVAFRRWGKLSDLTELKTDADVAFFLPDRPLTTPLKDPGILCSNVHPHYPGDPFGLSLTSVQTSGPKIVSLLFDKTSTVVVLEVMDARLVLENNSKGHFSDAFKDSVGSFANTIFIEA